MRKVADSASGAVTLDTLKPDIAVDLAGNAWRREARSRLVRAGYIEDVQTEIGRLTRRVSWLQRKARRLYCGKHRQPGTHSNGRAKALAEAQRCQTLAVLLPLALAGKKMPDVPAHGPTRFEDRALRLLHTLQAV